MQPLLDRRFYDRLRVVRDQMPEQGIPNLAHVFVPVGPERQMSEPDTLRVLVVGRATRGFHEDNIATYEGAVGAAEYVISIYVVEQGAPKRSDFWRFARATVRAALDGLNVPQDARLTDHLGWSNLAKIGRTERNPTAKALDLQAQLCQEALRSEMATMRPHAVIVTTGDYATHEVFFPVFGEDGWTTERTGRAEWCWKADKPRSPLFVWTEHPQGKHDTSDAATAIGAKIAATAVADRAAKV